MAARKKLGDNPARIELPPKLVPVFTPPFGSVRTRAARGGRGSGKSRSFALMASVYGYTRPLRILCCREFQVSLKESMKAEVEAAIGSLPWLANFYEIGESFIRGPNGTEFLFSGLRRSLDGIKSTAAIDLAIVEEAESVPERSWRGLIPTIRAEGSEIWALWNPESPESPVHKRFVETPDDRRVSAFLNIVDNPFAPQVLLDEMEHDRRTMDPAVFAHIWEGAFLEISEAQVLHGKVVVDSVPLEVPEHCDGPYYGADWGFSNDPTALVRFYRSKDGKDLFISHEAYRAGVEVVDTPRLFESVPGAIAHTIRADNARPELISHMRNAGWKVEAAPKWPGSVEDGVTWLRSHERVIVDPRCENVIRESRLWSYKTDRLTGDPLPKLEDGNDHAFDAIRYGASPMIRDRKSTARVRAL